MSSHGYTRTWSPLDSEGQGSRHPLGDQAHTRGEVRCGGCAPFAKPCPLRRGRDPDDLGRRRGQSGTDRTGAAHQGPARDARRGSSPPSTSSACRPTPGIRSRERWIGMPDSRRCGDCPPDAHVDQAVFLSGIHPEDRPSVETAVAAVQRSCRCRCLHHRIPRDRDRRRDRALGLHPGPDDFRAWPSRGVHRSRPRHHGAQARRSGPARERGALPTVRREFQQHPLDPELRDDEARIPEPRFRSRSGAKLREEVLGDPSRWSRLLHPDDRQRARGALERVRLGDTSTEEFRIVRKDRVVRWIRNTFFPIRDAEGQIRRAGGIAQDITRHDGRFVYVVDGEEGARQDLSLSFATLVTGSESFRPAKPSWRRPRLSRPAASFSTFVSPVLVVWSFRGSSRPDASACRSLFWGTLRGDVSFAVQVMKAGAVDFLPIPYDADQLLAAVASAAAGTRDEDEQNQEADRARRRIAEMSEREREVLAGLLAGKTNKEIGRDIGLSPRTVETYRARVMQRLGVQTLSQAVLVATSGRISVAQPKVGRHRRVGPARNVTHHRPTCCRRRHRCINRGECPSGIIRSTSLAPRMLRPNEP